MIIWGVELLKGIGRFFLNPLLYWFIILGFLLSYSRIKRERKFFGMKIFNHFAEWQRTFSLSLVFGLLLSALVIGIGIVFTKEMIVILTVVTVFLSLFLNLTFLSPSYTFGLTFIMMVFLPFIFPNTTFTYELFQHHYYTNIVLLLGFLLIIEAIFISRIERNRLFPHLMLSQRGIWVGLHEIKKLTLIPFFLLVPQGPLLPFAHYWPYLQVGEQTYHLILIPFILGFNFRNMSSLTKETMRIISRRVALLGFIVVLLALGSIYIPILTFVALFSAIIFREAIFYRQRMNDKKGIPYYAPLNRGLRVLAVIPDGPADRLGVLPGETIIKVNDIEVTNVTEFYEALQNSGTSFKLDVLDDDGEVRFLSSAFYETEHHELGIIFPKPPYYDKNTNK